MYVCTYVCTYVCMYVCTYMCVYVLKVVWIWKQQLQTTIDNFVTKDLMAHGGQKATASQSEPRKTTLHTSQVCLAGEITSDLQLRSESRLRRGLQRQPICGSLHSKLLVKTCTCLQEDFMEKQKMDRYGANVDRFADLLDFVGLFAMFFVFLPTCQL